MPAWEPFRYAPQQRGVAVPTRESIKGPSVANMKPCTAVKPVLCVTDVEGAETVISGLGVIELEDYQSLAEARRDLTTYLHRDTVAHVRTNNEAYERLVAWVNSACRARGWRTRQAPHHRPGD